MTVTLKFYRVSEKAPRHGQHIVRLKQSTGLSYEDCEMISCTVRYMWQDSDGTYSPYNEEDENTGDALIILFGQNTAKDNDLWMDDGDFWRSFGGAV